jgi:hypothetical protein
METKGDEHLHHPFCEICQREFKSAHELSIHIDQVHRSKDKTSKQYRLSFYSVKTTIHNREKDKDRLTIFAI